LSATERYDLVMAPPAKRALAEELPAAIAFAAWEFIDGPSATIRNTWVTVSVHRLPAPGRHVVAPIASATGSTSRATL
jgi:hypothetical protein